MEVFSSPVTVHEIKVEPLVIATTFLITATDSSNNSVLAVLDFDQLHQRVCYGAWKAGADDSDYEVYRLSNGTRECYMGAEYSFIRRKRDSPCFNA